MLHKETVTAETLVLIKELQKKDYLSSFYLVGGTALSLQIGHRTSTDIDLFSHEKFDAEFIVEKLKQDYGNVEMNINFFGIFTYINNIKVDIVFHPYKHLDELIIEEEIKMVTKRDVASMKLAAITKRGKKRDFVDLYFLLNDISLNSMLEDYIVKFGDNGKAYILRSLLYFDEADEDVIPKCFFDFDWEKIKKRITKEVQQL